MTKKCCIVGFSDLNRAWANEQPEDVELWGLNEAHTFMKRWDRWFQLHPRNWREAEREKRFNKPMAKGSRNAFGRNDKHVEFLKTCGVPVYMQQAWPDIPTSVEYPLKDITDRFGIEHINGEKHAYLTSSPAMMAALAIHEGYEEIRLAGIELAIGTEYVEQKPCLEWWLGLARGMGINVVRPPLGSSLLAAPLYAYEAPPPSGNSNLGPRWVEIYHQDFDPENAPIIGASHDRLDS